MSHYPPERAWKLQSNKTVRTTLFRILHFKKCWINFQVKWRVAAFLTILVLDLHDLRKTGRLVKILKIERTQFWRRMILDRVSWKENGRKDILFSEWYFLNGTLNCKWWARNGYKIGSKQEFQVQITLSNLILLFINLLFIKWKDFGKQSM